MGKAKRIKSKRLSSNVDLKPVPQAVRDEMDTYDKAGDFADAHIRKTSKTASRGVISKDDPIHVTFEQMKDQKLDEFAPVIPIATEENGRGGWDHILMPYHYHMVKEGRVCARCLAWQSDVVTLECRWRFPRTDMTGCGHKRNIDIDLLYKKRN